jgi:chromatin structure-remodeling complex subunit RSC9
MVLALRCSIDSEIAWALSRLVRISSNEQFQLKALPGLIEALFEWPLWYARGGASDITAKATLFSLPKEVERYRQHALESMFILRNAALNPINSQELSSRRSTQELVLFSLHRLQPDSSANVEFLLDVLDVLQAIATTSILPPPNSHVYANPIPPLMSLAGTSTNRSIIISALTTLHLLFSNPPNVGHMMPDSPAVAAAVRYIALLGDKPLLDASLNYLYTHLSNAHMTKAFLQSKNLAATLRMLVLVMLNEQEEETISLDIAGPAFTAPAGAEGDRDHELTREEFEHLLPMAEPQRCYEW